MASANDFVTRIATRLDTTGFDQAMRTLVNTNHQVDVSLNMATINRQITDLEHRLLNLNNLFNNAGGGAGGGGGGRGRGRGNNVFDLMYREAVDTAREISQIRISLPQIDTRTNARQINEAMGQLNALEARYRQLMQTLNGNLTANQAYTLNHILDTRGRRVDLATAIVGDTNQINEARRAYEQLFSLAQRIGSMQTQIAGLDASKNGGQIATLTNQLNQFRQEYANVLQSVTTLSREQQDNILGVFENTGNQLDVIAAKLADARQRLAESIGQKIDNGELESSISRLSAGYERLGSVGGEKVKALKTDIDELKQIQSDLSQTHDVDQIISMYERFKETATRAKNTISELSVEQKRFASASQVNAFDKQLSSWLERNRKSAGEFGTSVEQVQQKLRELAASGKVPITVLNQLQKEFAETDMEARKAGATTSALQSTMQSLGDQLKRYLSFAAVVNLFKQMAKEVLAVDTAMTGLYRVTNLSASQYKQLYSQMVQSAKQYGSTLTDIIDATTGWVKLGFAPDVAQQLANITATYQHVTDLDSGTAVKNLVTAYKGFEKQLLETNNGDTAAAITQITDIYDKLGNEFAESAADLGDGLSKSASVLATGGASIQQAAGLFTGIQETIQDSSVAGQTLKILTLRIRGMKGELEELGEEVDDDVDSLSKVQTQILNLTHGKVNIFDDQQNFRNIYEVLHDIAGVYGELNDADSAALLEVIAGKNRANAVQALLNQWDQVEKATEAAYNSAGTAAAEQEKYMQSLQGRLDSFKASWQALANDVLDSNLLKSGVDFGARILDTIDALINRIGVLIPLATALTAALSFKSKTGELIISSDADYTMHRVRRKAPNGNMNDVA